MTEQSIYLEMDDILGSVVKRISEGCSVTISGCGDSMEPFIQNGKDSIVLERIPDEKKVRLGEIYLYRRQNGRYAIHRVYKKNKRNVAMLGDSQLFIEKDVPKENLIAIVTKVIKKHKTVDCIATSNVLKYAVKMKLRILKYNVGVFTRPLIRCLRTFVKKVMRRMRKNG